ncbi:TonB-dependent receptor plug domain-containing protein [Spirosoma validum]|uniref:TonB-dependent receptor plug domain-containing protein n=1 Tax=Spirosoma validum TaxID=2771355 RepID=A0A927B8U4_9BACT|nr:TonB-dependent receptor plug domain-containing protein [Spirosoma validum]MBD2757590.1 TonB-dependent receptor plug domain-containing protein [Spirosoma validum]
MRPTFFRYATVYVALTAMLFLAFRSYDDDFIKRLLEQFRAYSEFHPAEKVYVHTDRDAYLTGETIWMKGYLFNGTTHEVDTVSQVLYVDLVDPVARRVRLRAQLRATNSYAPGQLTLPDSLAAGTYEIRAYTNYMRNYSEAYFFRKTLTILRPDGVLSAANVASAGGTVARPDVQFLPEGGQLVAGIESRVAFKAVNASGRSMSVEGFVLSAKKDTIAGFSSKHLGMGYFSFKPEADQTYTAFVKLSDATTASYPLPAVQAQGVVMQVDNLSHKDNIKVYVSINKNNTAETAALTLLAQTRGQAIQAAKIPLSKKSALIQLPRSQFPEGISQLTLFDETNKPICERLVFVNKDEQITVALAPNKTTYKNREKVDLTITTTNADGKPVPANLSLAAVDARLAPEPDSNGATITSHLLLSSDLTGTIEQPDYYVNPSHPDRWALLDLVLMTHGWRRFTWSDVLSGKASPIKYTAERGLSLTGRVVRPNQKDIGGKVKLTFLMAKRDSSRLFLSGETDEAGNFGAYDLDFTDTTSVLIQGIKGAANRNLTITLDQMLTPTVSVTRVPYNPLEFSGDALAEFIRRTKEYQEIEQQIRRNGEVLLQAVTVKAKKEKEFDSRVIYGTPDASVKFTPMNTSGRMTILDVIQGQIAGVQVMGTGMNASVQIRGASNFRGAVEPLFVLDGMPMDLQGIMGVSVQDVDRVDVLKGASAAIYGSRAAGGVISILTKRGGPNYDFTKDVTPGTLVAKLPGYAPVREFYAPQYDTKKPEHIRPDYRTTLFWAPLIQTDAQGKATISFFTSDAKTSLRLQAEGATISGMPGVGRATVKVN